MDGELENLEQESWEKGLEMLHDMSCQQQPDFDIPNLSEKKIITINCHGSMEEIISSLREVISKIEHSYEQGEITKLIEGKIFESVSQKAVAIILK